MYCWYFSLLFHISCKYFLYKIFQKCLHLSLDICERWGSASGWACVYVCEKNSATPASTVLTSHVFGHFFCGAHSSRYAQLSFEYTYDWAEMKLLIQMYKLTCKMLTPFIVCFFFLFTTLFSPFSLNFFVVVY